MKLDTYGDRLEQLQWWQATLGLSDWKVTLEDKERWETPTSGEVHVHSYARTAIIRLWLPEERGPDDFTWMESMLHELGHLIVADIVEEGGIEERLEEQTIWRLVKGWLALANS